jgi:putative protein kinase ArgK-like GTPase of G3E family
MTTFCTCLSGKTKCDCQDLELIVTDRTDFNNRKDMTKEEIEHEKLWTEGIVSAVMLSSKGIVRDFISNLEKVGYKIVKAESENERLKAERGKILDEVKAEIVEKFDADPMVRRISNMVINEIKSRHKTP